MWQATGISGRISGGKRTSGGKFFSGNSSRVNVTSANAMQTAAVNACVRLICNAVANLPIKVYQKGKLVEEHPLTRVLNRKPTKFMSGFEFKELLAANLLLRGNFYAEILHEKGGQVAGLNPINPDLVTVDLGKYKNNTLLYIIKTEDKGDVEVNQDAILHVKNLSYDGICGLNPVELARMQLETAASAEQYSRRWFDNDGTPIGLLKTPLRMSKEAKQDKAKQWSDAFGGSNKKTGFAILDEGMTYESVRLNNTDAQFLETREFQESQIAQIFGVPPSLLNPQSNTNDLMMHFYKSTVRGYCTRIEDAINAQLLREEEDLEVEFDLDSVLRGDIATRYNSYAVALQRFMTVNEVRALEGLAPVESGDQILQPLNMAPLGFDVSKTDVAENKINGAKGNVNVSDKGNQDETKME